jgi:hypothetical protein
MLGRVPDKISDKITYYALAYCLVFVYYISKPVFYFSKWMREKLKSKHRELNWLRKLSGIAPK